nr:hypothetical protein [bacterium]
MIHNITQGLILYQIEITCSIKNTINSKKDKTNNQEDKVPNTVNTVFSQAYHTVKKEPNANNKLIHKSI